MKCYMCKNYKQVDIGGVIHIFCGLTERESKSKILVDGLCNKFQKDVYINCNCDNCENYNKERDDCSFIPFFDSGKCCYYQTKDKQISLF